MNSCSQKLSLNIALDSSREKTEVIHSLALRACKVKRFTRSRFGLVKTEKEIRSRFGLENLILKFLRRA